MSSRSVSKLLSLVVLLAGAATEAGCSSAGMSTAPRTTAAGCDGPLGAGCRIDIDDGSFLRWAAPVTDASDGTRSTAVVNYEPGKLCMSGAVIPSPSGSGWGVVLVAGLSTIDATGARSPLDAASRGIAQVRFSVESPPPTGVLAQVGQLIPGCNQVPGCVRNFSLPAAIEEPKDTTVPLTAFTVPANVDSTTVLDPASLAHVQFYVAALPGMTMPYAFCIHELTFLDGAGREVLP